MSGYMSQRNYSAFEILRGSSKLTKVITKQYKLNQIRTKIIIANKFR